MEFKQEIQTLQKIQTLLDDYQRRLNTARDFLRKLDVKDSSNPDYVRLSAKISCYNKIISELNDTLNNEEIRRIV